MSILKITLGLLAFAIAAFPYLFAFYLVKKDKRKQPERFEENDGLNHDFEAYERGEFPTPDNMITPELIKSLAQSKGYSIDTQRRDGMGIIGAGDPDKEYREIYYFTDPYNERHREKNKIAFRLLEKVIEKTEEK